MFPHRWIPVPLALAFALAGACSSSTAAPASTTTAAGSGAATTTTPTASTSTIASTTSSPPSTTVPPTAARQAERPGLDGFASFSADLARRITAGDFTILRQRVLPTRHVCTASDANRLGLQVRPQCVEGSARDEVEFDWIDPWFWSTEEIDGYLADVLPAWSRTFDANAVDTDGNGRLRLYGYRSAEGTVPPADALALMEGISTAGIFLPSCQPTGCAGDSQLHRYANQRVGLEIFWRYVDGSWRIVRFNAEGVDHSSGGPNFNLADWQPLP